MYRVYRENSVNIVSAIQFAEGCRELGKKFDFTDEELMLSFNTVFGDHNVLSADVQDILDDQLAFYRDVYNEIPDFSRLVVPADPGGFRWILAQAVGMTANRIWASCKECFHCYYIFGDDLDTTVPTHERTADVGSYVIRVRGREEADEENK